MAGGAFVRRLQAVGDLHRLDVIGNGGFGQAMVAAGAPAF